MGEAPGPVYRSPRPNRLAAWAVLLVSLALGVGINAAGLSVVTAVIGVVCVVVAGLALSAARFQVRAEPDQLVVCSGGPTRRIPWGEVKGFGVDERRGRNVYVVVPGDRRLLLPIPEVRTGRVTAGEVRDQLQRYWKQHRR